MGQGCELLVAEGVGEGAADVGGGVAGSAVVAFAPKGVHVAAVGAIDGDLVEVGAAVDEGAGQGDAFAAVAGGVGEATAPSSPRRSAKNSSTARATSLGNGRMQTTGVIANGLAVDVEQEHNGGGQRHHRREQGQEADGEAQGRVTFMDGDAGNTGGGEFVSALMVP